MKKEIKRYDNHTHTHKSNIINRDSINFESTLIDKALELNLQGISITDHGNLSAHVDALLYLKGLREKANDLLDLTKNELTVESLEYHDKVNNFKLGLGTEIYLVDRNVINEARAKNEPTKFYHLVVVAKNYEGYRALAELSSNSWEESFYFRGMERIPTYKDYFYEWAKRNKGNVIVSSACLGSEFAKLVLDYANEQSNDNKREIEDFLYTMWTLFGEDFYIELQPSFSEDQVVYNNLAIKIADAYGIKVIITTDAHYASLEKKEIHSIYLKSQDAERETEAFYATTYLMGVEELRTFFPYIQEERFIEYMENSIELSEKIKEYDLHREIEVPKTTILFDEGRSSILAPLDLRKYPYISKYGNSEHIIDRTLLQQIEMGLIKKNVIINEEVLNRLNRELESLWEISEKLHQRMASYYLLTKEIVEIMWLVSLVGVSRGSAGAFYICYLLEICQINPIESEFNLPEWRHIDKSKVELADIDLDTEAGQRANILEKVKEKFGHTKVLNIATFKTEGTSSAIQTMCRGMGISTEDAAYISSLAPEKTTVKYCLNNYKTDKECAALINEMMNYEGLIENVLEIEGLVCGRSVHASGVYIFNDDYWKCNAMMKAPKGQPITQYDMSCSDYQGGLKLDFLTIESLDRIRKDLELLLEDGLIEWQGDLKSTYDKYIHPDVLEKEDKGMWDSLRNGEILDAFQYDSVQGKNAIAKIQPRTFKEAMDGNALMRLVCDGEQPIDRYVKHKKNINIWFNEMMAAGLNDREIEILKYHLLASYGVAPTQESVMRLSMDKNIAGFDLKQANKLRKAIAKSKAKHMINEVYNLFINQGIENGNRRIFLEYIWETCIVPQLGYAFSEPHLAGYTLILLQEMNLSYLYSSLHWKVACLCVNAGDINDDIAKATDYGAIAKAIGNMEKGFITPPDINNSKLGFKPDINTGKALYGLGAINGISSELAKQIIDLRPFTSIQDFLIRCVDTKIVQPSKMYSLIKSGCFDSLNRDRVDVMVRFINHIVPNKEKLTSANVPKLIEYGAIPTSLQFNILIQQFKKIVFDKKNCVKMINKTQGIYRIPNEVKDFFVNQMESHFMDSISYDDDGDLCLNSKEFDKVYKKIQEPLTEWLKSEEALNLFNYCSKNVLWNKYCLGSLAKWEMDSICYYTKEHELDSIELNRFYSVDNFYDLPRTPSYYYEENKRTGRMIKKNKLYLIAGTVVEKNKAKSMITLNTQFGVVDVKLHRDTFTHFDRKVPDEPSWFTRGTKLLIAGYRREESFIPKIYRESIFTSSIMKIEVNQSNDVRIKTERKFEEVEYEDFMMFL